MTTIETLTEAFTQTIVVKVLKALAVGLSGAGNGMKAL